MRYGLSVILALALAGCESSPPAPPPPAPPPAPPAAAVPAPPVPAPIAGAPARVVRTAIGPVLADARGMTLYTWAKDPPGRSVCYARCAVAWPPLLAGLGAHPVDGFSLVRRAGGRAQWAYKGKPLYTFVKDKAPGQTAGQGSHGFGALWSVARP